MSNVTSLVQIAQATGYEQSKIQLVKDTIARGASNDELMLFLHLAQRSGLDPFSRQIYLIERRQNINDQWVTTRQPQTGIDGLRLIADRTERYAPGGEPTFEYDEAGNLVKATAYVKKWVRGEWHVVAASAHYTEYVQTRKGGIPTSMWADKPHIMLAKCAEALALRRAFPAEMSGLYTGDEMRDDSTPIPAVNTVTGEIVDDTPPALPPPAESGRAALTSTYKALVTKARGEGHKIAPVVLKELTDEQIITATDELKRLMDAPVGGILPIGNPELVDN